MLFRSYGITKEIVCAMDEDYYKGWCKHVMKSQKTEGGLIMMFNVVAVMNGWRA